MIIETPKTYKFNYISFDYPHEPWDQKCYWNLRKNVFCKEQKIFSDSDRDIIDEHAIPIVALDECMGIVHNVIGAVRIDERSPRVWWGSRLCVDKDYRTHSRFNTNFLFSDEPKQIFTLSVGGALIYKAVTTANYLGCDQFFAHVQSQNVKFFKRLYWKELDKVIIHGKEHSLMEADLTQYPASPWAKKLEYVA
ncbi:MSMEG_0567/Sll0786 family nitrogen starvation N-acetyltransferase [Reichenbachiella versicolor]|uniref:MSMEG_0567/Sll0786 family nitrogen starvation N-acetyltransferase n=1 Tax=Reichenbachiella versicolor TaxID=1821036 RepID=UPI000D6E84E8|nr:MSMEG_0567/Sll0786 family nitrogen starvation N-acetyltransferase [Reichenbachiella versicolor]